MLRSIMACATVCLIAASLVLVLAACGAMPRADGATETVESVAGVTKEVTATAEPTVVEATVTKEATKEVKPTAEPTVVETVTVTKEATKEVTTTADPTVVETATVTKEATKEVTATAEPTVVETAKVVKEATKEVTATAVPAKLWADAEVIEATGVHKCRPVANLPKDLELEWVIGFINYDRSIPFLAEWEEGMQDAASFYGVKFIGMDAASGPSIDQLDPLLAQNPDLIGSQKDMDAIAARALELDIPYVNIDEGQSKYSPYAYGIQNAAAGKKAGEKLVEALQKRMAGEWVGRRLFFLEVTDGRVPACATRTAAAAKAVKEGMGLDNEHVLMQDPFTAEPTLTDMIVATLTSHPKAVFGMISCWDALGIGSYKIATEAGREDDILMVTLGADEPTMEFLKSKPKGYYGILEFQPYCEGWSWLETGIAILEDEPFRPYQVHRFVTQETVDDRFAELYR